MGVRVVEPRSCCLYNYRERKNGKSAASEGRANRQRRNNKPPHMRGFEGAVGVGAPLPLGLGEIWFESAGYET